jgi:rhodanese-related sulfurtransferase
MHPIKLLAAALAAGLAFAAAAQQAVTPASKDPEAIARVARYANDWKFKTKRLTRDEVDALLARPESVVFVDLRRPDEQIRFGSFPVFLSVQNDKLEQSLAYLPKDRGIVTVSNHSQRAGAAGDLLSARGYRVLGATGAEEYEVAGGTAVAHIQAPAPRAAASAATPKS